MVNACWFSWCFWNLECNSCIYHAIEIRWFIHCFIHWLSDMFQFGICCLMFTVSGRFSVMFTVSGIPRVMWIRQDHAQIESRSCWDILSEKLQAFQRAVGSSMKSKDFIMKLKGFIDEVHHCWRMLDGGKCIGCYQERRDGVSADIRFRCCRQRAYAGSVTLTW